MVSLSVITDTCGQPWSENIKWKIPEISFKLYAVLRSLIKSHAFPPHPAWEVNHPFVHATFATYQTDSHSINSACVQITFILLNNVPKAQE